MSEKLKEWEEGGKRQTRENDLKLTYFFIGMCVLAVLSGIVGF